MNDDRDESVEYADIESTFNMAAHREQRGYEFGQATRHENGSYVFPEVREDEYDLTGWTATDSEFTYVDGDLFTVDGTMRVNIEPDTTTEVFIYQARLDRAGMPSGPGPIITLTMRSCPDGVDPNVAPDECTEVVEDNGEATYTTGDGETLRVPDQKREEDGSYVLSGVSYNSSTELQGLNPPSRRIIS